MSRYGRSDRAAGKKLLCRRHSRLLSAVMILLAVLAFAGCGEKNTAGADDTGAMKLYYLDEELSSLCAEPYVPSDGQSADDMGPEQTAADMLAQLAGAPTDGKGIPPVQNFCAEELRLQDGALTVTLSADYEALAGTREILVRAAMVRTLCQIQDVDSVTFLCGDHALQDADGNPLGAETADMFIFNSDREIGNYEKVRLHLYFASGSGDQLVDTWRNVVYNSNVSLERVVVEQVLKGPNSDVVFPTLNPSARILSVTTRDGVCYVNFDQAFLTEPYDVTSQVAVYSLVNSLTELSSVQSVQITIDGKADRSFMEMSLSSAFERNLSMVRDSASSAE